MIIRADLPLRLLADLVRVGATVSVMAAFVALPAVAAGVGFTLVLVTLLMPRVLGGVPPLLDLALGATLLAATWAWTTGWTGVFPGAELLVHAATTGVTAATVHLVLAQVGLVVHPHQRVAEGRAALAMAQTLALGLLIGGSWEARAWFTTLTLPASGALTSGPAAAVLAADAAGAVLAGVALVGWAFHRSRRSGPRQDSPAMEAYSGITHTSE